MNRNQLSCKSDPSRERLTTTPVWPIDATGPATIDLERIARVHAGALHGRALAITGDSSTAWDLVHDAFERALRARPPCESEEKALAWLTVVMKNLYRDRLRARRRRPEVALENVDLVPSPEPDEDPPWSHLTIDQVRQLVGRLSVTLRPVYELHVLQGCSYAEISTRLRLSSGTVGTRLFRAREQLRRALAA